MKFTTLIPTTRNDGSKVEPAELVRLIDGLWRPFGGMTNEGYVVGRWIDPASGMEYEDTCLKVVVACERDRLPAAIEAVQQIGRQLGQLAMYFEVSEYDGVQILTIE